MITAGIDPDNITVISPYKGQKLLLEEQLAARLPAGVKFRHIDTIDSQQGRENEIVILCLTVANEHFGSIIGFLKEWNRMNVALTRAKSALWILGNWDCWFKQLEMLEITCKQWALFMIDLLYEGDIVDYFPLGAPLTYINSLPRANEVNGPPTTWTRMIENSSRDYDPSTRKDLANVARSMSQNGSKDRCVHRLRNELLKIYDQWRIPEDIYQRGLEPARHRMRDLEAVKARQMRLDDDAEREAAELKKLEDEGTAAAAEELKKEVAFAQKDRKIVEVAEAVLINDDSPFDFED